MDVHCMHAPQPHMTDVPLILTVTSTSTQAICENKFENNFGKFTKLTVNEKLLVYRIKGLHCHFDAAHQVNTRTTDFMQGM